MLKCYYQIPSMKQHHKLELDSQSISEYHNYILAIYS